MQLRIVSYIFPFRLLEPRCTELISCQRIRNTFPPRGLIILADATDAKVVETGVGVWAIC